MRVDDVTGNVWQALCYVGAVDARGVHGHAAVTRHCARQPLRRRHRRRQGLTSLHAASLFQLDLNPLCPSLNPLKLSHCALYATAALQ